MNNVKVAAALNTISLAFGELAEALTEAPPAHHAVPEVFEPSPFIDLPDEVFAAPQGSLAMCPKHHIPYTSGQYGDFCKSTTDDPAWGKQKGDKLWCRITPKNAAEWLRITAAA
jgi:hypothetical protein